MDVRRFSDAYQWAAGELHRINQLQKAQQLRLVLSGFWAISNMLHEVKTENAAWLLYSNSLLKADYVTILH